MGDDTQSNTHLFLWLASAVTVVVVLVAILVRPDTPNVEGQTRSTDDSTYRAEQQSYLDANALEEDVTVTPSGLQYRVVERSDGEDRPTAADVVRVHYSGRLIDGDEFDSSYRRGEPAEFSLNRVIPGWTEGLQLMAVGDTYEFTIPSHLAYGERGTPSGIRPGATLIFDVELLAIVK